jgi:hypothetical protein
MSDLSRRPPGSCALALDLGASWVKRVAVSGGDGLSRIDEAPRCWPNPTRELSGPGEFASFLTGACRDLAGQSDIAALAIAAAGEVAADQLLDAIDSRLGAVLDSSRRHERPRGRE